MDSVNDLSPVDPTPPGRPMRRRAVVIASVFSAAAIGGGAGVAIYAETAKPTNVTKTIVAASNVSNTRRPLTVGEIYRDNVAGVVEIQTTATTTVPGPFGGNSTQSASALGTGFVYDGRGDIVTNEHVVAGATGITVKLADGSTYKATVVGTDASHDLAVLHINAPASKLHPLTLADSSTVQVGDDVVAIGDQFGLTDSVTTGVVSALNRTITSPNNTPIKNAIQTDAAINHGSSGGVLLNSQGKVIGVTSQIESSSNGNNGVGFAIPSNTVEQIVSRLLGNT
jgi:putative serine protease PepD